MQLNGSGGGLTYGLALYLRDQGEELPAGLAPTTVSSCETLLDDVLGPLPGVSVASTSSQMVALD